MKISCKKDVLNHALHLVQRFSPAKTPLPIISGVLLEARGNHLSLTTSDLETSIQTLISVDVHEEGSAVLPTRNFYEIVRRLPDTELYLEKDSQSNSLKLKYRSSEAVLHGFEVEDFPLFPSFENGTFFEIKQGVLKEVIRKVVYAIGVDESKSVFSGVLFEVEGGQASGRLVGQASCLPEAYPTGRLPCCNLVASDAHRIALYQLDSEKINLRDSYRLEACSTRFIIPGRVLDELSKIIPASDINIQLAFNDRQVRFDTDEIHLISRLIEGDFPNYRRVIPREFKTRVKVKVGDLLSAVERASILSRRESSVIKLGIMNLDDAKLSGYNRGSITVSADEEVGKIYEEMECKLLGEQMEIGFNARYLSDVLKTIDTSEVVLDFTGPLSPAMIREATSDLSEAKRSERVPSSEKDEVEWENVSTISVDIDEKINYLSILLPVRTF